MIYIENVTKAYGTRIVLNNLTLEFPKQETTVIMGPSGCGKTTLLNLLLGLQKPDRGTIGGLEGARLAAVFQEDRLCPQLSARDNILLVLKENYFLSRIEAAAAEIDLDIESLGRSAAKLSGGQKRRTAILRAMLAESDLVCLDEPFKGLDQHTKYRAMDFVKRNIQGKTAVIITHDSAEASYFKGHRFNMTPDGGLM
jgi:NitT/TauT family transport system ATP-binding protein